MAFFPKEGKTLEKKHEHHWVLKETYLDPVTRNWRGRVFFCTSCPEEKLELNIQQVLIEAERDGPTPKSIVVKPTKVI